MAIYAIPVSRGVLILNIASELTFPYLDLTVFSPLQILLYFYLVHSSVYRHDSKGTQIPGLGMLNAGKEIKYGILNIED